MDYEQLYSSIPKEQARALLFLSSRRDRNVYDVLMDFLDSTNNEVLAAYTIATLGSIGDSRALFPLINYATANDLPVFWQRVLQYISWTGDPRAQDFLDDYLQSKISFHDIAVDAREQAVKQIRYSYHGSEEDFSHATQQTGQILVTPENLNANAEILDEFKGGFYRPQTFIINPHGELYIGGYLHEHVDVAGGGPVLGAGEIDFDGTSVSYLTHRSSGFFPHKNIFPLIANHCKAHGIGFTHKSFDVEFPRNGFNDPDFLSLFRFGSHYKP